MKEPRAFAEPHGRDDTGPIAQRDLMGDAPGEPV
jgi:hypothetical protein